CACAETPAPSNSTAATNRMIRLPAVLALMVSPEAMKVCSRAIGPPAESGCGQEVDRVDDGHRHDSFLGAEVEAADAIHYLLGERRRAHVRRLELAQGDAAVR